MEEIRGSEFIDKEEHVDGSYLLLLILLYKLFTPQNESGSIGFEVRLKYKQLRRKKKRKKETHK